MTALIDVKPTLQSIRRHRLTQVFAAGALAAVAVIGVAGTAQAAPGPTASYRIDGTRGAGSKVLSAPDSSTATVLATLADGRRFTVDCGTRGRSVRGNTVWHHITAPVTGYISDYYTNTPGFNQLFPGEATCGAPPVTTPPTTSTPPTSTPPTSTPSTGTRGQTISYNEGYAGSCVFYALDRFHQLTGVYPYALGDARYLATSAAAHGWTVSATPRINSLAVFQPGNNGAGAGTGHVAWVEQVSGSRIYVAEMNAPTAFVVSYRWIDSPASAVRYVYAA